MLVLVSQYGEAFIYNDDWMTMSTPREKMDLDANEAMLKTESYMLSVGTDTGIIEGYVKFETEASFEDKLDFLMGIQENITNLIISITAMHAQDGETPDIQRTEPACTGNCDTCPSNADCDDDDDDLERDGEGWKKNM